VYFFVDAPFFQNILQVENDTTTATKQLGCLAPEILVTGITMV
jgi:hypothetical protein